jgi:hypothetical protein
MPDLKKLTQEEFDALLEEIVSEEGHNLLSVPGVYEIVAEHFNNEVLRKWEDSQEDEEDEDGDS